MCNVLYDHHHGLGALRLVGWQPMPFAASPCLCSTTRAFLRRPSKRFACRWAGPGFSVAGGALQLFTLHPTR